MTDSDLSTVVSRGDLRDSLIAIRDLLAADANDLSWEQHKRECSCVCGLVDGKTRVTIVKELRAVLDAIEALPSGKEATAVDGIIARASATVADLAAKRAARRPAAASS